MPGDSLIPVDQIQTPANQSILRKRRVAASHPANYEDPSVRCLPDVRWTLSAIGLAILVVLFRNLGTINVEDLDSLKG